MGVAAGKAQRLVPAARCFGTLALAGARRSPTGTPLPRTPHATFSREEILPEHGARLVIVGDVHGCIAELRAILEKACFEVRRDRLVLVGDLVHKGPGSAEVIALARELQALGVRGNHDDQLLEAWYGVGRYTEGLDSYSSRALLKQLSCADISWVQELPLTLHFPWMSTTVVHAGLVPGVALEAQAFKDMLWMRDLRLSKTAGGWEALQSPATDSQAWGSVWQGSEHVVFGHDAKRKLQQGQHVTGLDTGCCYGNSLTALVIEAEPPFLKKIVQVPAARVYSEPKGK